MKIPVGIPMSDHRAFEALCAASGKWGLLIVFDPYPEELDETHNWSKENVKASGGFLNLERDAQVLHDGFGIFLFDEEDEMRNAFDHMVNHKYGPTEKNSYRGHASINAFTCSNTGQGLNENI